MPASEALQEPCCPTHWSPIPRKSILKSHGQRTRNILSENNENAKVSEANLSQDFNNKHNLLFDQIDALRSVVESIDVRVKMIDARITLLENQTPKKNVVHNNSAFP